MQTTVSTVDRASFELRADLVEAIAMHLAQADVVQVQDSDWPANQRLRYIVQWVGDAGYVFASEGAIASAAAGLGIVMTPLGACRRELEEGTLIRLLPDWDAGSVDLNAVFASGRAAKRSARAIADYLMTALRAEAQATGPSPAIRGSSASGRESDAP